MADNSVRHLVFNKITNKCDGWSKNAIYLLIHFDGVANSLDIHTYVRKIWKEWYIPIIERRYIDGLIL